MANLTFTRPRVKQPQGSASLNNGSPLTRGLVFCAVPVGRVYIDLVTGTFGESTGVLTAQVRPRNTGKSNDPASYAVAAVGGASDKVFWPISTNRGAQLVQTGTLLALGGTTTQVDGDIYPFGGNTEVVSDGSGFSLAVDSFNQVGRGNIVKADYAAPLDASPTELLGDPFDNRTHLFGYTFRTNGTAGNWLSSGRLTTFSGLTAHGTTTTNRRAYLLAHSTNAAGTRRAYCSLFCMWDREITAAEYAALYANPWQLFAPQTRRIWVSAAGGAAAFVFNPLSGLGGSAAQPMRHD